MTRLFGMLALCSANGPTFFFSLSDAKMSSACISLPHSVSFSANFQTHLGVIVLLHFICFFVSLFNSSGSQSGADSMHAEQNTTRRQWNWASALGSFSSSPPSLPLLFYWTSSSLFLYSPLCSIEVWYLYITPRGVKGGRRPAQAGGYLCCWYTDSPKEVFCHSLDVALLAVCLGVHTAGCEFARWQFKACPLT